MVGFLFKASQGGLLPRKGKRAALRQPLGSIWHFDLQPDYGVTLLMCIDQLLSAPRVPPH